MKNGRIRVGDLFEGQNRSLLVTDISTNGLENTFVDVFIVEENKIHRKEINTSLLYELPFKHNVFGL